MGIIAHTGRNIAVFVAVLVIGAPVLAARHPRLVSIDATKCLVCHGKMLLDAEVIHPPVEEDCTSCHEVSVTDDGTTVDLTAPDPELCVMCHDDKEAAVAGDLETPHAPVTDSCLSCHLPHAGKKALLEGTVYETCTMCHDVDDLIASHKDQVTQTTDCARCHQPHGANTPWFLRGSVLHAPFEEGSCDACHRKPLSGRIRFVARGDRLCAACHGDPAEDVEAGGSIHPALTGTGNRAGCISCHDPHLGSRRAMLHEEGNDLCATCHQEVVAAANAETGHAAAAEDCRTCHEPHTAPNPRLLVETSPDICLACHDAEDEDLISRHLGADLTGLDCTECHTPHGNGNESLLARNVHAAILDGCDTCHNGRFDDLVEDGGTELCLACHDNIGEQIAESPVQHAAMEMAICVDCHQPHATKQDKLIRAAAGGECYACHDDKAPEEGESVHGVITLLGCRACHEPHGGEREHLLRAEAAELCLSCHGVGGPKVDRASGLVTLLGRFEVEANLLKGMIQLRLDEGGDHGHPVKNHRTLGTPTEDELKRVTTTFEGELTCITCHDPHKGRSRQLLQWGARSGVEACIQCHPK